MNVSAITTCSAAGWEQYGRRMAASWAQHWPVPLTVWAEGFTVDVDGVLARDLTTVTWLQAFKRRHPYNRRGRYNFRLDAARFAHKTATVIEHALRCEADWLIWVDADTVTHADVPPEFVEQLLPRRDEFIAWLDRETSYPECGFYVLNLQHPQCEELLQAWRALYTAATVFRLPEWHDSFVLEWLVKRTFKLKACSLSGEAGRATSHPFINGPLGAYMDHLKGTRKVEGKSRTGDLKVPRTETYWKGFR
ncbi:MAG: hypothetical protein KF863_21490 [Rubrivivax sp.]|nr:hypothetical protein [Rubrivivax sp.]